MLASLNPKSALLLKTKKKLSNALIYAEIKYCSENSGEY
jgi:hypothetical protein